MSEVKPEPFPGDASTREDEGGVPAVEHRGDPTGPSPDALEDTILRIVDQALDMFANPPRDGTAGQFYLLDSWQRAADEIRDRRAAEVLARIDLDVATDEEVEHYAGKPERIELDVGTADLADEIVRRQAANEWVFDQADKQIAAQIEAAKARAARPPLSRLDRVEGWLTFKHTAHPEAWRFILSSGIAALWTVTFFILVFLAVTR